MKMIENDINNNELKQTYLLYGEERYLIRQYKDKLKKAIMGDGDSMNLSEFEGKDIEQKEIIDIAETMPFFAERRLIVVENSGFFKSALPSPLFATLGAGQPIFISIMSGLYLLSRYAAFPIKTGSSPKSCKAIGRSSVSISQSLAVFLSP